MLEWIESQYCTSEDQIKLLDTKNTTATSDWQRLVIGQRLNRTRKFQALLMDAKQQIIENRLDPTDKTVANLVQETEHFMGGLHDTIDAIDKAFDHMELDCDEALRERSMPFLLECFGNASNDHDDDDEEDLIAREQTKDAQCSDDGTHHDDEKEMQLTDKYDGKDKPRMTESKGGANAETTTTSSAAAYSLVLESVNGPSQSAAPMAPAEPRETVLQAEQQAELMEKLEAQVIPRANLAAGAGDSEGQLPLPPPDTTLVPMVDKMHDISMRSIWLPCVDNTHFTMLLCITLELYAEDGKLAWFKVVCFKKPADFTITVTVRDLVDNAIFLPRFKNRPTGAKPKAKDKKQDFRPGAGEWFLDMLVKDSRWPPYVSLAENGKKRHTGAEFHIEWSCCNKWCVKLSDDGSEVHGRGSKDKASAVRVSWNKHEVPWSDLFQDVVPLTAFAQKVNVRVAFPFKHGPCHHIGYYYDDHKAVVMQPSYWAQKVCLRISYSIFLQRMSVLRAYVTAHQVRRDEDVPGPVPPGDGAPAKATAGVRKLL